jgi:hypothetical protein
VGDEICTSCFKNLIVEIQPGSIRGMPQANGTPKVPSELEVRFVDFKTCPRCGFKNEPRSMQCIECGLPLRRFGE